MVCTDFISTMVQRALSKSRGRVCENSCVPTYQVQTARESYPCVVERGVLARIADHVPRRAGKIFIATTADVWQLYGESVSAGLAGCDFHVLFFPGGESTKRFEHVEELAEEMVAAGADRSSVMIALGGGIANDMGGFLASIFMRGIPVIQIPTTLLAQVDAAIGGKAGVDMRPGKDVVGAVHPADPERVDPQGVRAPAGVGQLAGLVAGV